METIYEYFGCKNKEELFECLKNNDVRTLPLRNLYEFIKEKEKQYIEVLSGSDKVADFMFEKRIIPYEKEATVLVINNSNTPLCCAKIRENMSNIDILRNIYSENMSRIIIIHRNALLSNRLKEMFSDFKQEVIDVFSFNQRKEKGYQVISERKNDIVKATNRLKAFVMNEMKHVYTDFTYGHIKTLKEYQDFTNYYTQQLMSGLNIRYDKEKIHNLLRIQSADKSVENIGYLAYSKTGKILETELIAVGNQNSAVFSVPLLMKPLLKEEVEGIIVYHNHPSGGTKISEQDFDFSKKLRRMIDAMGKTLYDSLIVTKEEVVSIAEALPELSKMQTRTEQQLDSVFNEIIFEEEMEM